MGGIKSLAGIAVLVCGLAVAWRALTEYLAKQRLPPMTEGFFLPQYRPVAELFRKFVEDGTERGGSFAVYHMGVPLVNLWGGYADPDSRRPWREDTVTLMFSCTKGATAVALAKLVQQGRLDYKAEIRRYWPEFAQNGKSNITVEMLASHQAGLLTLGNKTFTLQEYQHDWQRLEAIMAAAPPDFPPGSRVAYQALTFGMYVDAIVRRVDPKHRNLTRFFKEEIAEPYGIDFHIGLPRTLYHRAARVHFPSSLEWLWLLLDPTHHMLILPALINPSLHIMRAAYVLPELSKSPEILNDPLHAQVGLGSINGYGSASGPAKLYSFLANGGSVGDTLLLPPSLVQAAQLSLTRFHPKDLHLPKFNFSTGFQVVKNQRDLWTFGHDGYGCQEAKADPTNKLGIAYATNFLCAKTLTSAQHFLQLENLFYDCFYRHQGKSS